MNSLFPVHLFLLLCFYRLTNGLPVLEPLIISHWKWKLLSNVRLFVTPWTIQSMEFSRLEKLEWVAFPFSRGSSQPRDGTQVSHIAGGFFTSWAIREHNQSSGFIKDLFLCSYLTSIQTGIEVTSLWDLNKMASRPFLLSWWKWDALPTIASLPEALPFLTASDSWFAQDGFALAQLGSPSLDLFFLLCIIQKWNTAAAAS